jgi:hypothetical protein
MGLAFMAAILAEEWTLGNYKNETGSAREGVVRYLAGFH